MTPEEYFETHFDPLFAQKKFAVTATADAITFPIYDPEGKLLYCRYRLLKGDTKFMSDKGAKAALFAAHKIAKEPWVVLCEGEPDAIRLWQDGIPAVTGTLGVKTFNAKIAQPLKGKIVNLCLDTDEAGQSEVMHYIKVLEEVGAIPMVINLPKEYKDVCEYFLENSKLDFEQLIQQVQSADDWIESNTPESYKTLNVEELYNQEYPAESWIIDKFLPRTGMVMFSGDSGVGKSWIALEVVRALNNNDIFLDHFEIKTPNVPILIIDKENGLRRIQQRMKGLGIQPSTDIHLLKYPEKFALDDDPFNVSIQRFIKKHNIGIVIVDSFIDILLGNENDSSETAQVFNALRNISTNVCWVLLHHEVKPVARFTPTAGNRARGSTNIKAQLDYLFSLQATAQKKVINIEQGKARDYEMQTKFAIEFVTDEATGDMHGFKYLGEVQTENSKFEEALSFIELYLTDNPHKSAQQLYDIGESEGHTQASIKRAIAALKQNKIVDAVKGNMGQDKKKYFYFVVKNTEKEDEIMQEIEEIIE